MSENMDRIVALEMKVAALEATLQDQLRRRAWTAGSAEEPDARPVTRRNLMWSGGAAAVGAATGAVLATAQPAGAQQIAASGVAFVPTGEIMATNVQGALVELDREKASLTGGADFGGVVRMTDAQFLARPWCDVRAHGARGDGATDDTTAIQDAINVAAAYGGGIVLVPPGDHLFKGQVVVPEGVDIWGCGGHYEATANPQPGGNLLAGSPEAQIVIRGAGGQSGNLLIKGFKTDAETPDNGLVFLEGVASRAFTALRVVAANKDGIVARGAQNCSFTQVLVAGCERDALVLDTFSDNNVFMKCQISSSAHNNVTIRHTDVDSGLNSPQQNQFIACLIERGKHDNGGFFGPNYSQVMITGGQNTKFVSCQFTLPFDSTFSQQAESGFLILVEGRSSVDFHDCRFRGGDGVGAIRVRTHASIGLFGHCAINTGTARQSGRGIVWESPGAIRVAGLISFGEHNTGWEGTSPFHQTFPFTTRYFALDPQEKSDFVPELDGSRSAVYVKNGKFVVAYKDGGTMRYRTMSLTGTGTTWDHSTAAP